MNGTKQLSPATIHELLFAKTEMKYRYTYNLCYNFTGISGIIQITGENLIMDTLGFILAILGIMVAISLLYVLNLSAKALTIYINKNKK